jgi:AcrR family transcriptional regulator
MILTAAEELFLTKGFRAVSMRKVAEKIGYSATTIYNYFTSKGDLLQTLVQDYYKDYILESEKILKSEDEDPLGCLKQMLTLYVTNGLKHPNHYKLLIGDYPEMETVKLSDSEGYKGYVHLQRLFKKCVEKGLLKQNDPEIIAQGLWCSVYGITSLLTVRPNFPWCDKMKLVEHLIDTNLNGLK